MLFQNPGLRFGLLANFIGFGLLLSTKLLFKIPTPFLMSVGIIFFLCSLFFSSTISGHKKTTKKHLVQLLFTWCLTSVVILSATYLYDRSGWLWFKLTGYDITVAEDLSEVIHLSSEEFNKRYPFFSFDPGDSSKLILQKGEYEINKTVVVPPGQSLTIEAGTHLRFGAGRSLISYSPVFARGTEDEPIIFTAKSKWRKWGVVAVVKTTQSRFEYVIFEHGRQARVNNLYFPGSLSIIESKVDILRSQFINLFGKDAVYVNRGNVLIQHNFFRNAFKDGLDLDGGSGVITRNTFVNCEDEGIDLSANSDLSVFDNAIYDPKGGRMAAELNLDKIKSKNKFGYSHEVAPDDSKTGRIG
jgi:hypothetical protein